MGADMPYVAGSGWTGVLNGDDCGLEDTQLKSGVPEKQ